MADKTKKLESLDPGPKESPLFRKKKETEDAMDFLDEQAGKEKGGKRETEEEYARRMRKLKEDE